jgi:oxygen-dependent protoporphyrinogen oxidase
MIHDVQVAVIGGGIAGLCAGYWLKKMGVSVAVFEKQASVGGCIRTESQEGYTIDLGPNSALETSEILAELIRELGLEEQKRYGNEQASSRYIVRGGTLMSVPTSPGAFLKTRLFSLKAKCRLLAEPLIGRTNGEDLTLADFVRHRLGSEFLDYAINPFVAGVYAGDPETLSTQAAFPKLYALERDYGSFIKGAILGAKARKKRGEVAKDRAKLFSFVDGMSVFPQTLAQRLEPQVYVAHELTRLNRHAPGFSLVFQTPSGEVSCSSKAVLLATPTHVLSPWIAPFDDALAHRLSQVRYPPVTVVFTGFEASAIPRSLDGFGFLVPEREKRSILGTIWSSSLFPNRAPEGQVALTTFVGGTRNPQQAALEDEPLLAEVHRELRDLMGIKDSCVFSRIGRWPKAIPQYTLGYPVIQEGLSRLEQEVEGLCFAGNFRRGIGLGDSVLSAHETVQSIIPQLERKG